MESFRWGARAGLALVGALSACGRTDHGRELPGASSSGAGGAGGTNGSAAASGAAVALEPQPPLEARHALLGSPAARGCLTSLVPTTTGLLFAGVGNPQPFVGRGLRDAGSGWTWSTEQLTDSGDYAALVFGADSGQVLAWSNLEQMTLELFDAAGARTTVVPATGAGEPWAGLGSPQEFSLVFANDQGAWLLSYADGATRVVGLESEPCVVKSSVALGMFEGDAVVGYYCDGSAAASAPEAQHLVIARVAQASGEVTRTVIDAELGETVNGSVMSGAPAATWVDGELVFAHHDSEGATVLTRVTPGDPTPRTSPVSGMPDATLKDSERNPVYSIVQVGNEIALTRAICNGHEDALATGTVTICRIAADTLQASCSQNEAPCATAKLVANGSDVTLLACSVTDSPAIVPLDLAELPATQEELFPLGYSELTPLAMSCEGEACSALLAVNSAQVTTGYDRRLAFVDLDLTEACAASTCGASPAVPTGLFSTSSSEQYQPNITLEQQAAGLPQAVVTVQRGDRRFVPTLSLLGRDGVAWSQAVLGTSAAFFADGAGFGGLVQPFFGGALYPFAATENDAATGDALPLVLSSQGLPKMARCDDRTFLHAQSAPASSSELAKPAIYAFDPATGQLTWLFDPGYPPSDDAARTVRSLGCAGDRLFLLDGLRVHRYTSTGAREADIALTTLPPEPSSGDELLTSLASVGDHVVVASSTGHDLDALLLYRDGSLRSFRLPLPPGVTSLSSLTVAPDRGDGWLRVLYAVGDGATYARGLGTVYASAFLLGEQ